MVVPAFAITLDAVAGHQEHSKTAVVFLRKRSLPHPLLIHLLLFLLCGTYGFDFSGEHILTLQMLSSGITAFSCSAFPAGHSSLHTSVGERSAGGTATQQGLKGLDCAVSAVFDRSIAKATCSAYESR